MIYKRATGHMFQRIFFLMYRFFLAANIWCPEAEYTLMRVLWDTSVFLAWASLCSLLFPFLERWQRIDLISSKADGMQNEFLPLAGKRGWDKSRVARRGRVSVLVDSLMRSLSPAQRLTVRLSRPLSFSPNTCSINNRTPRWCWTAQKGWEKRHDGGKTQNNAHKNPVHCLSVSAWFIIF